MKIFTQIVLNQEEIETAIKNFVSNQVTIAQDQSIDVELNEPKTSDSEFTANVSISTDGSGQLQAKVTATTKTTGRGRAKTKDAAPATGVVTEEAKTEGSGNQDTDEADAPWNNVPENKATDQTEQAADETAALAPTNKIFPDAESSAAPATAPKTDPAVSAKSLFANLTRPTQ